MLGPRAPSFMIVRGEWAFDILLKEGYRYDSSLLPVRRAGYGFFGGQRDPHVITRDAERLHEFLPAAPRGGPNPAGRRRRLLPAAPINACRIRAAGSRESGDFEYLLYPLVGTRSWGAARAQQFL